MKNTVFIGKTVKNDLMYVVCTLIKVSLFNYMSDFQVADYQYYNL